MENIKEKIWYAGAECGFIQELPDTSKALDELQRVIDWITKQGRKACALHENGKHQLYVQPISDSQKEDRKDRYIQD